MPHRARPQILATFDDRPLCLIESGKQPDDAVEHGSESLDVVQFDVLGDRFIDARMNDGNVRPAAGVQNELRRRPIPVNLPLISPAPRAVQKRERGPSFPLFDRTIRGDSFPSDACARLLHHTDVRGFLFSCGTQGVEEVLRCHCPSQFAGHHVMDGGRISGRSLRIHQDGLDRLVPTPDIEVVSVDRYDHTAGQFVCGLRLGWNSSATRFPTRRSR